MDGATKMNQQSPHARLRPPQARDATLAGASFQWDGSPLTRILVPTDFSDTSWAVMQYVRPWIDAIGGEVLLLHVVSPIFSRWSDPTDTIFIDRASFETFYGELYEQAHAQLVTWLPSAGDDRVRPVVVVGNPAHEIVRVAREQQADLIIMGASRRGRWHRVLWGSVTAQVIRQASVPVITLSGVRPVIPHAVLGEPADVAGMAAHS